MEKESILFFIGDIYESEWKDNNIIGKCKFIKKGKTTQNVKKNDNFESKTGTRYYEDYNNNSNDNKSNRSKESGKKEKELIPR